MGDGLGMGSLLVFLRVVLEKVRVEVWLFDGEIVVNGVLNVVF
jgi:hypothetical protein